MFPKVKRLTAVRKLLDAHWSACRGTPTENRAYCTKEGQFFEFGTLPLTDGQAEQARWKRIHSLAQSNDKTTFYDEFPHESFKYSRNFDTLVKHYAPTPVALPKIDFRWYVGPSGSGKSSTARKEFPVHYLKNCNKWWNGYNGEAVVIIDDLSKDQEYMLTYLKTWADHYPFNAETKGGHTGLIRPATIIVTTQYTVSDLTEDFELQEAIRRRATMRVFN